MPLRKLEQLFDHPVVRSYKKGHVILHEGDDIDAVFYVKKGYAKLYTINEDGEERVLIIIRPKAAFPISFNMIDEQHAKLEYYYEAMTDVQLYVIPSSEFRAVLQANAEATRLMLNYVVGLSMDLIRRIAIIENKDAKNKITHLLAYLVRVCSRETKPGQYVTELRITQQDIANMTGLTRETASTQMKKLKDEGVVRQRLGKLIINKDLLTNGN